jgi:hypothetical protein
MTGGSCAATEMGSGGGMVLTGATEDDRIRTASAIGFGGWCADDSVPAGATREVDMLRLMKELGDPAQSAMRLRHWLILNARGLAGIAFVVGSALFIGFVLNQ